MSSGLIFQLSFIILGVLQLKWVLSFFIIIIYFKEWLVKTATSYYMCIRISYSIVGKKKRKLIFLVGLRHNFIV